MHYERWDYLHFWSLRMDQQFHRAPYLACDHLSILGLRLIHDSKGGAVNETDVNTAYMQFIRKSDNKHHNEPRSRAPLFTCFNWIPA